MEEKDTRLENMPSGSREGGLLRILLGTVMGGGVKKGQREDTETIIL